MTIRVGINGFGRIGRQTLRAWLANHERDFEVVAINDPSPVDLQAHLLQFDSEYGPLDRPVEARDSSIVIGDHEFAVSHELAPSEIDWGASDVDVVVESTGKFRDREHAGAHLRDSVRKVLISANGREEDWTVVYGVNHDEYDPSRHHIISAGSCTTNCVVPVASVLHSSFGIRHGMITTVHAYTGDQNLMDGSHQDWRRARAAAHNIIPTSTGASKAVERMIPALEGRISGIAMRVPTSSVSVVDLVTEMERSVTVDELNAALCAAAEGPMRGVLYYEERPLVSSDFIRHPGSSIVDATVTTVVDGTLAKSLAWYDNEWGYASRIGDICAMFAERGIG